MKSDHRRSGAVFRSAKDKGRSGRRTFSSLCRYLPILLLAASGCREAYLPPPVSASSSPLSLSQYPVRTDLMVIGQTGLDGAPKHWPTPGFPPLWSARFPRATPDADLAADIRGQGKNIADPTTELSAAQTSSIAKLLEVSFGTPAEPRVELPDWPELSAQAVVRLDPSRGFFETLRGVADALKTWDSTRWQRDWTAANQVKADFKLDDATLAHGAVIYRRLCLQCHGLTGAGDGAEAVANAAMPRDYRQGIFKFISAFSVADPKKKGLSPGGKPRREDLKRTIRNGLDGSMMPAFSQLPEPDLEDLVSYVIHLSIRGETEFATMRKAMKPTDEEPEFVGPELAWLFYRNFLSVLENWGLAARSPIPIPPEYAATDEARLLSAFRGYKFYNSAEFGCAACHINYGREPALKWDLWGTVAQPRNLVLGVYRGGRRGEDLYARLYGGIYPSGMTAFHPTLKTGPSYPERPDKIWNVVHFLQALGDPRSRQRLADPAQLARFKERLKEEGDLFLDDLNAVKIEP